MASTKGGHLPDNITQIGKIGQPLLATSMMLIYLYLLIYVFYEAYTEIDHKDEDFIGCTCHSEDERFYKALFGVFTTFWIIAVLAWSTVGCIDLYQFW